VLNDVKPEFIKNHLYMKKISLIGCLLILAGWAFGQELGLDDILKRHFVTSGMEQLQKVKTIVMKGTTIQNDAMPAKIIRVRPDKYLIEFDVADLTAYMGYDGENAWSTAPWTGNSKPQLMPEDRARDVKTRADFDGILYQWKEKGHQVELVGNDTVENNPAYKLKVIKADGGVEFLYISRSDLLLIKRSFSRMSRGKEVTMDNYYRDYREVQGIRFPFTIDTHFAGQPYNSLQLDTIELDVSVDMNIFVYQKK
jgi:hypothetical protein